MIVHNKVVISSLALHCLAASILLLLTTVFVSGIKIYFSTHNQYTFHNSGLASASDFIAQITKTDKLANAKIVAPSEEYRTEVFNPGTSRNLLRRDFALFPFVDEGQVEDLFIAELPAEMAGFYSEPNVYLIPFIVDGFDSSWKSECSTSPSSPFYF